MPDMSGFGGAGFPPGSQGGSGQGGSGTQGPTVDEVD